jgi:hypothetical protein
MMQSRLLRGNKKTGREWRALWISLEKKKELDKQKLKKEDSALKIWFEEILFKF